VKNFRYFFLYEKIKTGDDIFTKWLALRYVHAIAICVSDTQVYFSIYICMYLAIAYLAIAYETLFMNEMLDNLLLDRNFILQWNLVNGVTLATKLTDPINEVAL